VQFSEVQKPRDPDLGSGHTAYRSASVIDLYILVPNFVEIVKTFFLDALTAGTPPNSRSRDTSRKNIKNPAWSNLDIVL